MSDLQNRVDMLEKAVGRILTGKDHANISGLKIYHQGIPSFNATLVAFSARSGSTSGISVGFTLKFSHVITNLGNHYNPTDGIFIAPVHGLYMFHWTMNCFTTGSNYCGTSLMINGSGKGQIYSGEDAGSYYHTGSNSVIVEVQAGDHVWIETNTWSNVRIHTWSSFSGFLMSML
ncbi:complement C1q-like protein 2 isoform X1 [Saccostrea echinata]|uniref:complement C1q-like protein 2 isoform X1 n=1 Tax=Saccostrea echinata TaxID=191078 RepID=UPI002A813726|nr:complement C1q-like protein 2 isoform X1 [Saccostrea echinata]